MLEPLLPFRPIPWQPFSAKTMIPLYDDQPVRRPPIANIAIILLNALVFIGWQQNIGVDQSVDLAGFVPLDFKQHEPGATTHLVTSMFLHAGWMHIIGNMWFLWVFGRNIEDACGHFRYVCFYVLCGAGATLLYAFGSSDSPIPMVGASGAISGVMGAFLLKYPRSTVRAILPLGYFSRIIDLPAIYFLLIYFGMQVVLNFTHQGRHGGGVAYLAHIGGFFAGAILIFIFQEDRPATPSGNDW